MAKVKLVRMPERSGLMRARMEGVRVATAEVGFSISQTTYIHIYYYCMYWTKKFDLLLSENKQEGLPSVPHPSISLLKQFYISAK